ncbi:Uracil-DNA glycosylase, mitochondrial [Linum perenne]
MLTLFHTSLPLPLPLLRLFPSSAAAAAMKNKKATAPPSAASSRTIMDLFNPSKRPKLSSPSKPSLLPPPNHPPPGIRLIRSPPPRSPTIRSPEPSSTNSAPSPSATSSSAPNSFPVPKELLVEETWQEALPGELQKPYAKTLCSFVESEIRGGGVPVYPPQHLVFNALNTTPFDRVKVVIIGQDPYHGPGQAMGLSFSVPEGVKSPSSLVNIFKELKQDVGCSVPSHGNLEKWAIQGVLLLNAVLTVREHQANSHAKKGWEQFTDAVIRTISQKKKGVIFLLWGNFAQEKSRHFSQANNLLEKMGVPPLDWQL